MYYFFLQLESLNQLIHGLVHGPVALAEKLSPIHISTQVTLVKSPEANENKNKKKGIVL